MKKFKENQKVYCLYVNIANNYISFKVEENKYLGVLKNYSKTLDGYFAVENNNNDDVNFLQLRDIFATEDEAMIFLSKLLIKRVNKK